MHRTVLDTPVVNLVVVGVKSYKEAETIAIELVSQGVKAIQTYN
ncbi:DUF6506 family protein [Clostridium estertheticum]|nr:DUF6506 family protein [Clostridium estertheticum]MBZ9618312.1 DUF6506 family protein [Clostridium estertheticum subsp. laramiense]WAG76393.1 DUF6506 family protein [Clostridium estertheticum]